MKLAIVIVNYNVTDLTVECLRSLSSQIPSVADTRVMICENGTGEEAATRLQQAIEAEGWQDWASVTAIYPNRGFTGGNNAILDPLLASGNGPAYFWLLNADTVVRLGAVAALVDFMDAHPDVGIGGSRLEDPDGTPQCSAFRFHNFVCEFDRGMRLGMLSKFLRRWQTCRPIPETSCETDWVSGASLIVRRQVLEQIGTLDEGYYTYFDDIDICYRAKKVGWPSWYIPASRVVHYGGQTTGIDRKLGKEKRRPPYWFHARRRFFLKTKGRLGAALADAAFITAFSLWRVRRFISRKPDLDPDHFWFDSIKYSVFGQGFQLRPVENPLLKDRRKLGQTKIAEDCQ